MSSLLVPVVVVNFLESLGILDLRKLFAVLIIEVLHVGLGYSLDVVIFALKFFGNFGSVAVTTQRGLVCRHC